MRDVRKSRQNDSPGAACPIPSKNPIAVESSFVAIPFGRLSFVLRKERVSTLSWHVASDDTYVETSGGPDSVFELKGGVVQITRARRSSAEILHHELHRNEVDAFVLRDVIDGDDTRVIER